MGVATLLAAVAVAGVAVALGPVGHPARGFQAVETCTSNCTAQVNVEVSNDNVNFLTLGTINLTTASGVASDGFASQAQWNYMRGNLVSITGASAVVTLTSGLEP